MNNVDYKLIYEVSLKNDFSIFDEILSSFISYIFLFIIWKFFFNGKFKKIGIVFSVFFLLSTSYTLVKESLKENRTKYRVVEGEVSNFVKASYYNRKGGSFMVNGVKFHISMSGIDNMLHYSLHFMNGKKVKIYYAEGFQIVKFWIENDAVILENSFFDNNYSACFQASIKYREINKTKAKELVLKSTKSNNGNYSLVVYKLYKHGILFEKNITKANLFLKKASEKRTSLYSKDERVKKEKVPKSKDDSFDILDVMD